MTSDVSVDKAADSAPLDLTPELDGGHSGSEARVMLRVEGLEKRYGRELPAVSGVSLTIKEGEFFSLLGPSGCGKTTTLRSVAGLEHPDHGRIELGGNVLFDSEAHVDVKPDKRNMAMVFQSYAIWPHMSVFANAAFPLQVKRKKLGLGNDRRQIRAEIERRVLEVLDLTGLVAMKDRSATALSGGQQQRLALARALVASPDLLILDEPLSNLDANLRHAMRSEIKRIQMASGVTVMYVTHDQNEALSLSTTIGIMDHGHLLQVGSPHDLYAFPATPFVAGFVGHANMIVGACTRQLGAESILIEGKFGSVNASGSLPVGTAAMVALRRDRLQLRAGPSAAGDGAGPGLGLRGRVREVAFLGDFTEVALALTGGDEVIWARLDAEQPLPAVGAEVVVDVPAGAAVAFRAPGSDADATGED